MNTYRNWFLAMRPWSFSMSAISVSVGAAMAAVDGHFSWVLYLATLLGMVAVHGATNMMNDYYDVASGVDQPDTSTANYRPHPLVEGRIRAGQVLAFSLALYGLAVAIGLWLSVTRGWTIAWIALIGAAASWTYTGPPLKYKYYCLGELSVFLMWGPLMVEGAYFVQARAFSWPALLASLPFGTLVALVILANNVRDINHDQRQGIKTLAILIGRVNGLRLYAGLVIMAFISVVLMAALGTLPLWSLMVLLSLPLAWRLLSTMIHELPADADARTGQLDTSFGALLVISLVLGHFL